MRKNWKGVGVCVCNIVCGCVLCMMMCMLRRVFVDVCFTLWCVGKDVYLCVYIYGYVKEICVCSFMWEQRGDVCFYVKGYVGEWHILWGTFVCFHLSRRVYHNVQGCGCACEGVCVRGKIYNCDCVTMRSYTLAFQNPNYSKITPMSVTELRLSRIWASEVRTQRATQLVNGVRDRSQTLVQGLMGKKKYHKKLSGLPSDLKFQGLLFCHENYGSTP